MKIENARKAGELGASLRMVNQDLNNLRVMMDNIDVDCERFANDEIKLLSAIDKDHAMTLRFSGKRHRKAVIEALIAEKTLEKAELEMDILKLD